MPIFTTMIAVAITIILFAALIKQTMRADRAEAALAKIEATVAECERAAMARTLLDGMRQRASKLDRNGDL